MLQALLHNAKMVSSIYGTEELVQPGGTLRKAKFDNTPYPSLGVGVEPANYPAKPPAKWQLAGFNTCVLGFRFTEVTALTLTMQGEFRLVLSQGNFSNKSAGRSLPLNGKTHHPICPVVG